MGTEGNSQILRVRHIRLRSSFHVAIRPPPSPSSSPSQDGSHGSHAVLNASDFSLLGSRPRMKTDSQRHSGHVLLSGTTLLDHTEDNPGSLARREPAVDGIFGAGMPGEGEGITDFPGKSKHPGRWISSLEWVSA